jgi:hypothetical protein
MVQSLFRDVLFSFLFSTTNRMDGMPEEVQQLQLLLSILTKLDTITKIARQKMKEPLLLLL